MNEIKRCEINFKIFDLITFANTIHTMPLRVITQLFYQINTLYREIFITLFIALVST